MCVCACVCVPVCVCVFFVRACELSTKISFTFTRNYFINSTIHTTTFAKSAVEHCMENITNKASD